MSRKPRKPTLKTERPPDLCEDITFSDGREFKVLKHCVKASPVKGVAFECWLEVQRKCEDGDYYDFKLIVYSIYKKFSPGKAGHEEMIRYLRKKAKKRLQYCIKPRSPYLMSYPVVFELPQKPKPEKAPDQPLEYDYHQGFFEFE